MGDTRPSFLFVNPEDCPIAAFCLWKKLRTRDYVCLSSAKFSSHDAMSNAVMHLWKVCIMTQWLQDT